MYGWNISYGAVLYRHVFTEKYFRTVPYSYEYSYEICVT